MAKGTIERKCLKGHNKAEGRCSSRCLRWYPRIERPGSDDRRKFDYLGGYRTRTTARAALDAALHQRRESTAADPPVDPAGPTVNQLLDRWLAHLHNTGAIRLRTIGRYRQLLEHHVRPYLGNRPITSLGTLHIQELYDQLVREGRRDGKPGGLHPLTIRQVHYCLHQALGHAVKWHGLPTNPAAEAEPPALRLGREPHGKRDDRDERARPGVDLLADSGRCNRPLGDCGCGHTLAVHSCRSANPSRQ
jgi:hypothetical protein